MYWSIHAFRLPSLAVSTPELMARTKDAVSDCMLMPNLYFTVATEFIASLAIVQLLLRSTDVVLGKVGFKNKNSYELALLSLP